MRLRRHVAMACAIAYMIMMSAYLTMRPSFDWDMIAYVAVALHMTGTPTDRLQQDAYDIVRSQIPAAAMDSLTGRLTPESLAATSSTTVLADVDFRKAVATDPQQFLDQLPFFAVKPVYPAMMAILHLTGIDLIESGQIVSAVAFFGIGLLLYVWFSRWMPAFSAVAVMTLLVLNPFLVTQARTIGPDILSICALLVGVYLAVESSALAAMLVFILAIPIRPENVLYAVIFVIYLGITGRLRPVGALVLFAVALLVELSLTHFAGGYGWHTLFYYSFVSKSAALSGDHPHLGWLDYLNFYLGRLDRILMGQGELPIFALIGFGGLVLKANLGMVRDKYVHLIVLAGIIGAARMIVLPTEAFRALLPCYMIVTVAFIQACAFCKLMIAEGRRRIFETKAQRRYP